MRSHIPLTIVLSMAVLLLLEVEAWAGPGGQVAKAMFKSPAGKIIVIILGAILLPLVIYVVLREWLKARATKNQLAEAAREHPVFAWEHIEGRSLEALSSLYKHWSSGDISSCRDFMTEEYYADQCDLLERWREEGKRNITELGLIKRVRPLYLNLGDEETLPHVWVHFELEVKDYLVHLDSYEVVKGSKRSTVDFDVLYLMLLIEGEWRLAAIQDGDNSLAVARTKNVFDKSGLESLKLYAASPQFAEVQSPDESEQSDVSVP